MNAPIADSIRNDLNERDFGPEYPPHQYANHARAEVGYDELPSDRGFMSDLLDAQQQLITAQHQFLHNSDQQQLAAAQRGFITIQTSILDQLGVFG